MALARYESVAVNLAGDVIPNATVEVRRDQPGRPVVPLFSDREGTVALGNPITADSEGKFGFHVPGGVYYIRVFTGPSQQPLQQYVRRYQAIGTAAERDVEDLATALQAGTATFPTLADLEAFVPSGEGIGGKVTTGEDAGFYHYDDVGETWVFDRPLYDTLARMTVTGGTADAVEASIDDGIVEAAVIAFMIKPTLTNTGPLTINAKPVLNVDGDPLAAGEFPADRWITFTDEGANYQLTSDPAIDAMLAQAIALVGEAEGFRDEAEEFRDEAAGYAAGLNIPAIVPGDASKVLRVKGDETGSEWVDLDPPDPFGGDAGAGGTEGLVPAPAAGDAAAGKVLGAGGGWVTLALVPRGHIYGLTLSNDVTDANNGIVIAAGEAASDDAANAVLMAVASAFTKRTDAAWAVGSGNGGWLDGAAMPNGVGHVFQMLRSDTGVVDYGISASATAPVLPANYDRKRRIGAIIRDSGALLPFSQMGNKFLLRTPVNVSVGSNPGTAAILQAMKVPTGIQVDLLAEIYMQSTDANRRALKITSPDQNAVTPAAGTMSTFVAGTTAAQGNISGPFEVRTNTSGQFRFQLDGSSATTSLFFTTNGWIDHV